MFEVLIAVSLAVAPSAAILGAQSGPTTGTAKVTAQDPNNPPTHTRAHPIRRPSSPLHVESCFNDDLQETVRCGWLKVQENRSAPDGRTIDVRFVVLPAKGQARPDAIITFAGGPGASAVKSGIARWAAQFEKFREDHDILLIEQRGTGESNGLYCSPVGDPNSAQTWLGDMYTAAYVDNCREALETHADLTQYHTSVFVQDVEDVRAALGYSSLDIMTGSYGTRVAIAYMQRFPNRVRCAFLWSCNTTDMRFPTFLAPDAQAAMDALFADVAADPVASVDYPNLRQELDDVLARLRQGPVTLTITNPMTDAPETVQFGYYPFVAGLRSMLYSNSARVWIPLFIYLADRGNYAPAAQYTASTMHDNSEIFADGMYLSVECNENVSRMNVAEAHADAVGTFMGNYRIDQQKLACDLWPRASVPESFFEPRRLTIPTLILSGANDPVTPPRYGAAIAAFMVNSLQVVVPHWAHGFGPDTSWWKDGFDAVALEFVERASVEGLDPSCVESYTAPPFESWRDHLGSTKKQKKKSGGKG